MRNFEIRTDPGNIIARSDKLSWERKILSWVEGKMKEKLSVLATANSNLPDRLTRRLNSSRPCMATEVWRMQSKCKFSTNEEMTYLQYAAGFTFRSQPTLRPSLAFLTSVFSFITPDVRAWAPPTQLVYSDRCQHPHFSYIPWSRNLKTNSQYRARRQPYNLQNIYIPRIAIETATALIVFSMIS
jgi:hypothetical protein